jgi:hypothetical protein
MAPLGAFHFSLRKIGAAQLPSKLSIADSD